MSYQELGYLTVLVVDDDAAMRALIVNLVIGEGHQAIPAGSAEAGLETLPHYRFDVAFLDHNLPGMEGLVLGEYLARNNPRMSVVLVSGETEGRLARQAEAVGATFVAKPFEPERLVAILEAAEARERAPREAPAPSPTAGPVDLVRHWATVGAAFSVGSCPSRLESTLNQGIREALEAIAFRGGFDEEARATAYTGLIAMRVLGLDIPSTRSGQTYCEWYDTLMIDAGRPASFSKSGSSSR